MAVTLTEARQVADALARQMEPYCEQVAVAGSVRRGKPDPKDLEIVAVPTWTHAPDQGDLFGEARRPVNRLHEWALRFEAEGHLRWVKPGTLIEPLPP